MRGSAGRLLYWLLLFCWLTESRGNLLSWLFGGEEEGKWLLFIMVVVVLVEERKSEESEYEREDEDGVVVVVIVWRKWKGRRIDFLAG